MELVERPNLRATHFLNSILFDTFRDECVRDANINQLPVPTDTDILTWFNQLKTFCNGTIKTNGNIKRIYSYSLNTPVGLGGRLFCGGSLQSIWSPYRSLLMRDVGTDIDMKNAHPVILSYICKKHDIKCPYLDYYNANREECWKDFKTKKQAKQMYLIATNSDTSLKMKNKPSHFKGYEIEMKNIQNELIKIEDYKDLINSVPASKVDNFNGSAINRILCYYENIILGHAIHFVNSKGIEIAILMFDGLMIYGNYYNDHEFLQQLEQYVNEQMPTLKMQWAYKEHDTTFIIPDEFDEKNYKATGQSRFVHDDNSASKILFDELKPILFADNTGRLFYKRDNIWITNSQQVEDCILHYIINSNICKKNDQNKYIPYTQSLRGAKSVCETLILKIRMENVKNMYEKFHSTCKGKICFIDGVLDFQNKKFYKWENVDFEIYSPMCIDYEYEKYHNSPNYEIINEIKNKIFTNMFGDKTDIALQFLSRAIAGHCDDKNWATYLGRRDCGKGVIYDALKFAFQQYIQTFELGNILYERHTDINETSRKLYWLMELEFVRLAISQETPTIESGLKASSKMIKKLAGGGDEHVARRNYDKRDTTFKIDTTFMIFGNDELILDGKDANEHRLQFSSCNQFKSQHEIDAIMEDMRMSGGTDVEIDFIKNQYKIKDTQIKNKCNSIEWKMAMIRLIYDNYSNKAVDIDFEDNDSGELDTLRKQILLNYEITYKDEDNILPNDIIKVLGCNKKALETELKDLKILKGRCNCRNSPLKDKVVFKGLKRKNIIIEESDEYN